MINKSDYHKLKKYLKTQPKVQILHFIDSIQLNDEESKILLSWYNGDTRVKMSMDNYICDDTCTCYLKKIFSKIYNYFVYENISF